MSSDWPLVTVTFVSPACSSNVTLRHAGIPSGADRDGAQQGWTESLDRLAEYLAKA
jgi:hypothetical protein